MARTMPRPQRSWPACTSPRGTSMRRRSSSGWRPKTPPASRRTAKPPGSPAAAVQHVEHAAALYDPNRHQAHSFLFGQDPDIICKAYGAVALWLLGYPDQAERQSDAAVRASRELSATSRAVALHFAAMLHQMRRDAARALTC